MVMRVKAKPDSAVQKPPANPSSKSKIKAAAIKAAKAAKGAKK